MGLLGLPFAEEHGGIGAGPVEVAIVAEEIGRVLAPEPFVEAVVLAGGLIGAVGTDEQKSRLLDRDRRGDADRRVRARRARHPLDGRGRRRSRATQDGDGWPLSGVKEPVLNGARADVLVVSAVDRRRDPAVRRRRATPRA